MRGTRRIWFASALAAAALLASTASAEDACYGKTAVCQRQAMRGQASEARPEEPPATSGKSFTPSKTALQMLQRARPAPRREAEAPAPLTERCTYKTSVCQRLR